MTETMNLTIIETSDIHGSILPINYGNNQPAQLGLAKVASVLQIEKEKNPNIVIIDNGDLIQGTALTYYYSRIDYADTNPMISALHHMEYDAAVLGNHEFNYGQDILQKAIDESQFPWLSCNILCKKTKEPFYGKPYKVKVMENGLRVGILGLTTHYIPNWENPTHIEELIFEDAVVAAKKWVPYIRNQEKVDVLILSYHGGFERDLVTGEPTENLTSENQGYQLCYEVEGIDVLLTGHQHRSIATKVNGIPVIQPSHQGRAVGKVSISLEKEEEKWTITTTNPELIEVNESIEADPIIMQMTQPFEEKTQLWLDQPIGKISGDMLVHDPLVIRTKDSPLIEFFNKVQMDAAKVDISNTALFDNFSPGLHSNVTMRDIVANYIYPNTLKVLRVTGQDIKEALERSASYFASYNGYQIEVNPAFTTPKPQHYNYDMWEGIEYKINISKPIGERIVHLYYQGKPLEMDKEYDVVMNNYRAGGGGDYTMFQGKPVVAEIPTDVSELIANYIFKHGQTIEATVNHNWEVIF